MALTALPLTSEEIRAIRAMPEFKKKLKKIEKLKQKAEAEKEAERLRNEPCPGAAPIAEGRDLRCPKCGLFIKFDGNETAFTNHLVLMRGEHWNRGENYEGNPFTRSGLYGKAAQAADGDWYSSH